MRGYLYTISIALECEDDAACALALEAVREAVGRVGGVVGVDRDDLEVQWEQPDPAPVGAADFEFKTAPRRRLGG